MEEKSEHIRIPAYSTDRRQLVQITELIIDGKKVIQEVPLQAYQTILRSEDRGTA